MALENTHPQNSSDYAPRSSELYPSTSTGLPSNSTMIRIRGKYWNGL